MDDAHSVTPLDFLLSRKHTPLESLRQDLSGATKSLRVELIDLINADYADFIALSTTLVDVDELLDGLQRPLESAKAVVKTVQDSLLQTSTSLKGLLDERAFIVRERDSLGLAHQIAESIGKTEGLLDGLALGEREDSQQALERVAIEYNQLKFLLGKGKRLPPVESQKTLEKISLLEARLKDILSQALQDAFRALQPVLESSPLSLKNASTIPPIKKQARSNKDQEELLMNLSRTCVLLDKVTLIANHFRDVIVDPFIQRTVNPEGLEEAASLADFYSQLLAFARVDCAKYCELTQSSLETSAGNLLTDAVWPGLIDGIMLSLPVIFNPGLANTFHENYLATLQFLDDFEALYTTHDQVLRLRSHPTYIEFQKRWQLPVYFQIRTNEIVSDLETCLPLAASKFNPTEESPSYGLSLTLSVKIFSCLKRCWSDDLYLPGLDQRCIRLSFQLLAAMESQFKVLLESNVEEQDVPDLSLMMYSDIMALNPMIMELLVDALRSHRVTPSLLESFESVYKETWVPMTRLLDGLSTRLVSHFVRKCSEPLKQVRNIPSQYRRTNRDVPTKCSFFLPLILKPWNMFLDSVQDRIPMVVLQAWSLELIKAVMARYTELLSETLTLVKSIEDGLKRFKKKGATRVTDIASTSDEDKIRIQMSLDVEAFRDEVTEVMGGILLPLLTSDWGVLLTVVTT